MGFRFGLEAEYIVTRAESFEPLWHDSVSFNELNSCLERIDTSGLPSLEGLRVEAPHRKRMPFIVEGYHVPEAGSHAIDILPKGVEIRTPVCNSIAQCLDSFQILFDRMQQSLAESGLAATALSHHPLATRFHAPQGNRSTHLWHWAMEAMMTYGPDINVSFPAEVRERLDLNDLMAKINHYAPAMTALSLASPFHDGDLWRVEGSIGKAYRTYRRSIVAPPIEIHPQEGNRIEFKVFEMSDRVEDFQNFFFLFLTLVLDESLKGRASAASRIYGLGAVAVHGLASDSTRFTLEELLNNANRILPRWGFDTSSLESFFERLESRRTPADGMIELYESHGLTEVLRSRSRLHSAQVHDSDLMRLCV